MRITKIFAQGWWPIKGAILALRRLKGLSVVVAEGVETQAHGEMLLSMGCPLVQGDGLARAMPASAIPAWVQAWHTKPCWTA